MFKDSSKYGSSKALGFSIDENDQSKAAKDYFKKGTFDTGGYTGKWTGSTNNAEGRLAVLHEKELVLNSKDTENILSAVKIQRNLLDSIKDPKTFLQLYSEYKIENTSSQNKNINLQATLL